MSATIVPNTKRSLLEFYNYNLKNNKELEGIDLENLKSILDSDSIETALSREAHLNCVV